MAKTQALNYRTYLAIIKNSVGSRMFRNSYMRIGGKTIDILENGNLSCAFYVSSLLLLLKQLKLIKSPHGTVKGIIADMKATGWKETKRLKPGAIILWEEKKFGDQYARRGHKHLGFYIGKNKAISNSSKLGMPVEHNLTFGRSGTKKYRKIEKIFWHKSIN